MKQSSCTPTSNKEVCSAASARLYNKPLIFTLFNKRRNADWTPI